MKISLPATSFAVLFLTFSAVSIAAEVKVSLKLEPVAAEKLYDALNVKADVVSVPCEGCTQSTSTKTVKEAGIACVEESGTTIQGDSYSFHTCTIEAAGK